MIITIPCAFDLTATTIPCVWQKRFQGSLNVTSLGQQKFNFVSQSQNNCFHKKEHHSTNSITEQTYDNMESTC